MADAVTVIGNKCKQIKKEILKGAKIVLGNKIKEALIARINLNFYERYDVGENPHWLIESLKVSVDVISNTVVVCVYFDNRVLSHTTWWGSEKTGTSAGDSIYSTEWINDGWTFDPYTGNRMRDIAGVNFLEDTVRDLQMDKSWIDEFYQYLRSKGINVR